MEPVETWKGRAYGRCRRSLRNVSPYKDLYVYLVEGALDEGPTDGLGKAFLGNWVEGDSSFLFFTEPSQGKVDRLLRSLSGHALVDSFHFSYEQWQGGGLEPLRIPPFFILPPWMDEAASPAEIRILLDPGVVFGNGLHPTTRHCLEALRTVREKGPLGRVLDLGTGTGILALGAAALGASEVLALDLNPLCVKTARKNVERNGLEGKIRVRQGRAEETYAWPCDLILANIHHEVVVEMLAARRFLAGQRLVISGQMRSQARALEDRLQAGHFRIIRRWDHEMTWYTVLAET